MRAAMSGNPASWLAHGEYGNALAKKGDIVGAIAAYREALRLKPEFIERTNCRQ